MLKSLGLLDSLQFFSYLMISFAFFVGILLLVSQDAFNTFDKELQKEYGIRKRFFPKIEDFKFNFIDIVILKYRVIAGLVITITAFILLLIYK